MKFHSKNEFKGTVKWFDTAKGYGFIKPEDGGKDVFVHISSVEKSGLINLLENQQIKYGLHIDRKNRECADNIKILKPSINTKKRNTKQKTTISVGFVKWFGGFNRNTWKENNYGFINTIDSEELYLNGNQLDGIVPVEDEFVIFEINDDKAKGKKTATKVEVLRGVEDFPTSRLVKLLHDEIEFKKIIGSKKYKNVLEILVNHNKDNWALKFLSKMFSQSSSARFVAGEMIKDRELQVQLFDELSIEDIVAADETCEFVPSYYFDERQDQWIEWLTGQKESTRMLFFQKSIQNFSTDFISTAVFDGLLQDIELWRNHIPKSCFDNKHDNWVDWLKNKSLSERQIFFKTMIDDLSTSFILVCCFEEILYRTDDLGVHSERISDFVKKVFEIEFTNNKDTGGIVGLNDYVWDLYQKKFNDFDGFSHCPVISLYCGVVNLFESLKKKEHQTQFLDELSISGIIDADKTCEFVPLHYFDKRHAEWIEWFKDCSRSDRQIFFENKIDSLSTSFILVCCFEEVIDQSYDLGFHSERILNFVKKVFETESIKIENLISVGLQNYVLNIYKKKFSNFNDLSRCSAISEYCSILNLFKILKGKDQQTQFLDKLGIPDIINADKTCNFVPSYYFDERYDKWIDFLKEESQSKRQIFFKNKINNLSLGFVLVCYFNGILHQPKTIGIQDDQIVDLIIEILQTNFDNENKSKVNKYLHDNILKICDIHTDEWFPKGKSKNKVKDIMQKFSISNDKNFEHTSQHLRLEKSLENKINVNNATFNKKQKKQLSSFFSSVERNPLTDEQMNCCICMDNAIQIVASAGSGKTSTIVSRIGYALKEKFIQANEILILTFNKDIQKEMKDRIRERLYDIPDIEHINVNTFNAFGLEVIGKSTKRKPEVPNWVKDFDGIPIISEIITELRQRDSCFKRDWDMFQTVYSRDIGEMKSLSEDKLINIGKGTISTEGGDLVKSHEEEMICNFLFFHGVPYEYEKKYEYDTVDEIHSQYRPDFFYPGLNFYHEHFALDAKGNAPDHFSEKYISGVQWKRKKHNEKGTQLFETTSYGLREGNDLDRLKSKLEECGAILDSDKNRVSIEQRSITIKRLAKMIRDFQQLIKSNELSLHDLNSKITSFECKDRLTIFIKLYNHINNEWQRRLQSEEEDFVDFNDMELNAIQHIKTGAYQNPYTMILVDEFQDVSQAKLSLLKALKDSAGRSVNLCVVGDDWQGINRFAGADISFMMNFEQIFENTTQLTLNKTFRCPQSICDASSNFIQKNPKQIKKTVETINNYKGVGLHTFAAKNNNAALDCIKEDIDKLFKSAKYENSKAQTYRKLSVMLLGRYKNDKPNDLEKWQRIYGSQLEISFSTVHSAKGMEADVVILLNAIEDEKGFPSQIVDDPILQIAMPESDDFPMAEERRLFYVALTRARQEIYIYTLQDKPSRFVVELAKDEHTKIKSESGTLSVCPKCKNGIIIQKNQQSNPFEKCSSPSCNYVNRDKTRIPVLEGSFSKGDTMYIKNNKVEIISLGKSWQLRNQNDIDNLKKRFPSIYFKVGKKVQFANFKTVKPSDKQINFARILANEQNIKMPENIMNNMNACSVFIDTYKNGGKNGRRKNFESEKSKNMVIRPPSVKQLDYAKVLASKHGIDIPENVKASMKQCSAFIDKYKNGGKNGRRKNVESEKSKNMVIRPPSVKQLNYAKVLASKHGIDIPENAKASMKQCSAFIGSCENRDKKKTNASKA